VACGGEGPSAPLRKEYCDPLRPLSPPHASAGRTSGESTLFFLPPPSELYNGHWQRWISFSLLRSPHQPTSLGRGHGIRFSVQNGATPTRGGAKDEKEGEKRLEWDVLAPAATSSFRCHRPLPSTLLPSRTMEESCTSLVVSAGEKAEMGSEEDASRGVSPTAADVAASSR